MELGEYATNVLSINNFVAIHYDYFEFKYPYSGGTRAQLRKVETSWRQEGALVHCDPLRDGIWRFRNASAAIEPQRFPNTSTNVEVQGIALSLSDHGTYEPANIGRGKQATGSSFNTSSNSSSPSSSLESSIRNAQAIHSKAVQANTSQVVIHEPPTPSPGTKSTFSPGDSPPSLKGIHERFISAVLGSIVYFLCRDHGYLPLNARTLIVKSESVGVFEKDGVSSLKSNSTVTLATLDISLTSLGTLVVKAHSDSAPRFQRLMNISYTTKFSGDTMGGTPLWLAPGGHAARFYGYLEGNQMPAVIGFARLPMSPADQSHNLNGGGVRSWKANCLDLLAGQGLNTSALDNGGWALVQILRRSSLYPSSDRQGMAILEDLNVVPWPALLCFHSCGSGVHDFRMANFPGGYDPLSFAEGWFMNKDERSKTLLRRQKERQIIEASTREQADADSRTLLSNNFSPHALRRGSNAGAIYPTPPDAVHHPIGATPSFDGTASTPGNPNQLFTHDVDTTATNLGSATETGVWGSSDSRQELTKPSVHFNDNDNENDNLFGDIGGDLFGDTDITDADFSFFDEPDAAPLAQSSGPPAAADLKASENSPKAVPVLDDIHGDDHEALDVEMPDSELPKNQAHDDNGAAPSKEPAMENDKHHETRDGKVVSFKTPLVPQAHASPPFTKEAVFKLLFKGSPEEKRLQSGTSISDRSRRASSFKKVDVETPSVMFNEKYGAHGRFNYSESKQHQNFGFEDLPKTEYLHRRRKSKINAHEPPRFAKILSQEDVGNMDVGEIEEVDLMLDSEGTSPSSEQDETSHTVDDLTMMLKPGVKRKRDLEKNDGDEMASSFKTLAVELDLSVGTPQSIAGSPLPILDIDPADWSLAPYITSQHPDVQPTLLTDDEYMATAQILADQAVSSTLSVPGLLNVETPFHTYESSNTREVLQNILDAAKVCLNDVTTCSMRSFLEIQGIPVLNQNLRLPPRPMPHPKGPNVVDSTRLNNPFPLPIPRLEVRRSDSNLTILPAGVSFWDNLGLGPSQGPKDINAICVYPKFEGLAENASTFLGEMKSTYESYRFGNHDRILCKDLSDGVLPLPVDSQQTSQIYTLAIIKETMVHLSKILLSSAASAHEKNFVVYFIYPTNNAGLLVHICSAFDHLFNLYRKGLSEKKAAISTELVLQLIPLDFVASATSLAVPKPSEYARLAMEVYDRCIEFLTSSSIPAILLERPLPKSIDFKLNPNPSPSLLSENSCLHIAYAQSIDDRWITAAWTDNRGSKQMTASYCLGRKNEQISMPFSDVAHEIWETTLGLISHKKVHWRLMVAKVGTMDPAEIEFWTGLASTESDAQVNLTLIAANTDPSLQLLPESMKMPPVASITQTVLTPVSTPQAASILSPENASTPMRDLAANPPTPIETTIEPDSDARLIDLRDQSWGAVLSHRLNNSKSLLEFNPALISGYLIKRGGTSSSDAPIILEVNIIHSDIIIGNPRTFHEGLLREILNYYRGLATLARVRGVVDGVKDGRPWHIAAAEKAVAALYMLM